VLLVIKYAGAIVWGRMLTVLPISTWPLACETCSQHLIKLITLLISRLWVESCVYLRSCTCISN